MINPRSHRRQTWPSVFLMGYCIILHQVSRYSDANCGQLIRTREFKCWQQKNRTYSQKILLKVICGRQPLSWPPVIPPLKCKVYLVTHFQRQGYGQSDGISPSSCLPFLLCHLPFPLLAQRSQPPQCPLPSGEAHMAGSWGRLPSNSH